MDASRHGLQRAAWSWVAALGAVLMAGCSSWPFAAKQRTSIITPAMRVASIREFAPRAADADPAEQQRIVAQLTDQIRTEPDPIVRQAIQATIAEFPTPLARDVLIAGLQDTDLEVRLICCHQLSKRAGPEVVGALRGVLESDDQLDARLAAVDALGAMQTTESVAALGIALQDRDPALQYAAVQALKSVSGEDFGNDVAAWRQYVSGEQPQISVADKRKGWSPF